MLLLLLLIFLFLIVAASNWFFGAWSNLIVLVNLIIAGLVASSFYENLAFQLYELEASYVLLWEFVALWALFALTYFVLRCLTDSLSGTRLRFDSLTEMVGRSILCLLVAWTFVCFVSFTLHRAPLPTTWFEKKERSDRFELSTDMDLMGPELKRLRREALGPDLFWINFVRSRSTGSLAYSAEETLFFPAYKRVIIDKDGNEVTPTVREFFSPEFYIAAGKSLRSVIARSKYLRVSRQQ